MTSISPNLKPVKRIPARNPAPKRHVKKTSELGEAFARLRGVQSLQTYNDAQNGAVDMEMTRATDEMTTDAQQLVAPDEWDALLSSFEGEGESAAHVRHTPDHSTEELWDRLSSTRWVKTSSRRN